MQLRIDIRIVYVPQVHIARGEKRFLRNLLSPYRLHRLIDGGFTHTKWILNDQRVDPSGFEIVDERRTGIESYQFDLALPPFERACGPFRPGLIRGKHS